MLRAPLAVWAVGHELVPPPYRADPAGVILTFLVDDVDVAYRDIKHLHISVHPPAGRVRVAAPRRVAEETIRIAVVQRLRWIREQRSQLRNAARQTGRRMVSGESHYVWGRRYRLDVSRTGQEGDSRRRAVLVDHPVVVRRERPDEAVPAEDQCGNQIPVLVEQLDQHVRSLVRREGVDPQRDVPVVRRIAETCDVVVHNLPPAVAAPWASTAPTVRADPRFKTLPMVMITSSAEEQDMIRSYNLGVNGYVVKPVSFAEFRDALKQVGSFWAVLNELPPQTVLQ